MGKWCLQASLFSFDRIFVKLAGNQDRHKISDEFDFWLDQLVILVLHALERQKIIYTFKLNTGISKTNWPVLVKFYV